MAWGAGAGGDGGVEAVDVDGDVVRLAFRDQVQYTLATQFTYIAHREDFGAGIAGGVVVVAV
ncbi:hypothetical protein D3C76_845030 [compost metagenome]